MKWAFFLHFYQPHNQQLDILERVVNESYRKVLAGLSDNPGAKINININAGLTELLVKNGYIDVIEQIKDCAEKGQIEFTGGVKYHPFLPLLPKKEIKRQIELNEKTNKKYFGKAWKPKGFFSPELGYSKKVAEVAKECGFKWILAEQFACSFKTEFKKIYNIKGFKDFKVIFRDKRISVLILSAIVRNIRSLIEEIGRDKIKEHRYVLTVMDVETFGHHRPGLENLLFQIYKNKEIKKVFLSELVEEFKTDKQIEPYESTWASEEQDFWLEKEKKHSFTLWSDPKNPIHKLQWGFTYFVINVVNKLQTNTGFYKEIREKLDQALQSDQYWWASARPWWSLEMIEQGAYLLKNVVFSIPTGSNRIKNRAEDYYRKILDLAFVWQRQGKIRQAYRESYQTIKQRPYKKRVLSGQFNAIILEFENEMNNAIKAQEFEKAIKWRDAIYKLKSGMDIYDVLHVVDDLRNTRHLPSLKDYWEHSAEEFSIFAKKHFVAHKQKQFEKKQPKQLFNEIKSALFKKTMGHPLGFYKDEYNNIYFCEIPCKYIEHWPGQGGWDAMSLLKFDKPGKYHHSGQCNYEIYNNKLKIIIGKQSLVNKVLNLLKQNDINNGEWIRLAILAENNQWAPVFFKKNKKSQLVVQVPYNFSKIGQGIKFKICGWKQK